MIKSNQSDSRIKSKDYKSIQLDFLNEKWFTILEFENLLLDDGLKIIDVGAVKLEIFTNLWRLLIYILQLIYSVIPSMDGSDDFAVAMSYLQTVQNTIPPEKIIFSLIVLIIMSTQILKSSFHHFWKQTKCEKNFSIDLNDENN